MMLLGFGSELDQIACVNAKHGPCSLVGTIPIWPTKCN